MSKVVERIRKLLAVAAGSGASKNEMETAARLAQELMQEHKLSELDVSVESSSDGSAVVDLPAGKEGFMATWRFALVTGVARAFFCEALGLRVGRSRKVRIIGRRDDAEVVLEVAAFLVKEIERLTDEFNRRSDDDDLAIERLLEDSTLVEQRKAYRSGLAFGVASTLEEQAKKWREVSEKALALYRRGREEIDDYRENKFGASHNFLVTDAGARLSAFDHGYVRGREIKIVPQPVKPISEG